MIEIAELLQKAGAYGIAAVFYWLFTREQAERQRYRDLHEKVLSELPAALNDAARTIEDLKNEIARLSNELDQSKQRPPGT